MKYRKNHLTHVIFQLKFDPIWKLESDKPDDFHSQIKDRFPRKKEGQDFELQTSVSPEKSLTAEVKRVRNRWAFLSDDGSKIISVVANEFSLEYTKYDSIATAKSDFEFLWGKFNAIYGVQMLERIGLRYVNEIVLPTGDPLEWKGFIADNVVAATLGVPPPEGHGLARSMNMIRWLQDDHRITFNFGIYNTDFPGRVAKREFVLDFDCFSVGPIDASSAPEALLRYNDLISALFERSIGDRLREEMGIVESRPSPILEGD